MVEEGVEVISLDLVGTPSEKEVVEEMGLEDEDPIGVEGVADFMERMKAHQDQMSMIHGKFHPATPPPEPIKMVGQLTRGKIRKWKCAVCKQTTATIERSTSPILPSDMGNKVQTIIEETLLSTQSLNPIAYPLLTSKTPSRLRRPRIARPRHHKLVPSTQTTPHILETAVKSTQTQLRYMTAPPHRLAVLKQARTYSRMTLNDPNVLQNS